MWLVLILPLSLTWILAAYAAGDGESGGVDFEDNSKPVEPYDLAELDEIMEKTLSHHPDQLREILQKIRTKFFSSGKRYKDSWLHQIEQLLDEYEKADGFLKELKKPIGTKWNGQKYEYTTIIYANGAERLTLPTLKRFDTSDHQLKAFYESVYYLIDDFEIGCFGDDFVKLFEKILTTKTIDSSLENLMEFLTKQALETIKKPLLKLEEAPKKFNYDDYFKKLNEIHKQICTFKAAFRKFQPLVDEINREIDPPIRMIQGWYEKNGWALEKIEEIFTELQDDGEIFVEEVGMVFGSNEDFEVDMDEMKTVIINNLDKKLNSIDKKSKLHKFLINIRTVLDFSISIETRIRLLEDDITKDELKVFKSKSFKIQDRVYTVPSKEKINQINEIIFVRLAGIIQNAWFTMDQTFFSDDAVDLYGTFSLIESNIEISEPIFDSVESFATKIQSYAKEIENAEKAFRSALPELIKYTIRAREAKSFSIFSFVQNKKPEDLWKFLDKFISKSIIRVAKKFLIRSIEQPTEAKNTILIAHRKMLGGIAPLFQLELEQKYQYPLLLNKKKTKTVTFDIKISAGSEEFDKSILGKIIDEKIKLFDEKRKSEHEKNKSLPTAINPSTKSALNALKMIVNHVYEMYDGLKSNRAELIRNNPNELTDSDHTIDNIIYPNDVPLNEINDKQKDLILIIENGMNALKPLCSGDIHEKILETLKAIENDPEINEKIDLKNIQTKYDEFKRINHDAVIAKFTNAIFELQKNALIINNAQHPNEMLTSTKDLRSKLIGELRTADIDLKEKLKKIQKIITDIQLIDVLEHLNKILFGKLIDDKMKLLPKTNTITIESLDSIKKITNYAYEMYERFKLNWIEMEDDISKPFQAFAVELVKGTFTRYPDSKIIHEMERIRTNMEHYMKTGLNELKEFCDGDMHKQIRVTVKSIEKDWIISEKIDSKNIGLKYNQFKQLFANDETIKKFKKVNSEFRKLIVDLRQNPKEMLEKSKDRRDALINELKTAMDHLNIKIQNAKEIILEMKVIEVLGKINSIFFGKLIDEKIKLIPRTSYPTRMALEALKGICNFAYDMNNRLKSISSELERDNFNAIKSFDFEIVKGIIERYPNDVTTEEIKNKKNNLIETIAEALVELKHRYNGDIHKQIIETVNIIEVDSYPVIDEEIDSKNIGHLYNEFKQLIQDKTVSEFLNAISKIRRIIDSHRNGPISSQTYKELEKGVNGFMEELRTADEFLQEKIKKAHDFIFDIQFIEVLREITNGLLDKMPKDPEDVPSTNPHVRDTSKVVPTLRRIPTTIHKGIRPTKSITNFHGPLSILPGGEKQPDFDDNDDDADNDKGMIIDPPSPVESKLGTSSKEPAGPSKHEERPSTPPSPRATTDSKPVTGSSSGESPKKPTKEVEARSTTPPPSRPTDSKTPAGLSIESDPSKTLKHEQATSKNTGSSTVSSAGSSTGISPSQSIHGTSDNRPLSSSGESPKKPTKEVEARSTTPPPSRTTDSKTPAGLSIESDPSKTLKHEQAASKNTGSLTVSSAASSTGISPSQSILGTSDNRPLVPKVATRGSPAASVTGQSSETPQSGSVHSMSYIEPDHGNDEVENVRRHKWACPCPKCGVQ